MEFDMDIAYRFDKHNIEQIKDNYIMMYINEPDRYGYNFKNNVNICKVLNYELDDTPPNVTLRLFLKEVLSEKLFETVIIEDNNDKIHKSGIISKQLQENKILSVYKDEALVLLYKIMNS